MADGTVSLNLLKTSLKKAQTQVKGVTQSYLTFDYTPQPAPPFMRNSFTHLVPGQDESLQSFYESLIYLNRCSDPRPYISLSVGVAMMEVADPGFWKGMRTVLKEAEFTIEDRTISEVITLYPSYENLIDENHTEFRDAQGSHYIYAITLFMTLIGKSLMQVNYAQWMRRRRSSFAGPLSIPITDELLDIMAPSVQVAQAFNQEVRALWSIRREFFIEIWAQHKKPSLLGRGFQVTTILLKFAEFANFNMPATWLVVANPILLMWGELNKELPYLCAAFEKYHSLNELGPWAKLFLPPEELEEFSADKLSKLYAVAKHIASVFGPPSINQIQGVMNNKHISEVCDRAVTIVRAAGKANSRDTQALRLWKYGNLEDSGLMEELQKSVTDDISETTERRASVDLNARV